MGRSSFSELKEELKKRIKYILALLETGSNTYALKFKLLGKYYPLASNSQMVEPNDLQSPFEILAPLRVLEMS